MINFVQRRAEAAIKATRTKAQCMAFQTGADWARDYIIDDYNHHKSLYESKKDIEDDLKSEIQRLKANIGTLKAQIITLRKEKIRYRWIEKLIKHQIKFEEFSESDQE